MHALFELTTIFPDVILFLRRILPANDADKRGCQVLIIAIRAYPRRLRAVC